MNHYPYRLLVTVLIPVALLLSCKKQSLIAGRASGPIQVDGLTEDWQSVSPLESDKYHFRLAAQHDDQTLYFLLSSEDPTAQRQLINSGLILWFDQDGDGRKDFGIKYPRGIFERGLNPMEIFMTLFKRDGSWNEKGFADYVRKWCSDIQLLDAKGNNLGILNHYEAEECGIRFQMAMHNNLLAYELAVQRQGTKKVKWDLSNKTGFRVGFETPPFDFSAMRRPMGGFAPGGADAGGGGGMPMGGRGMGRGPGGGGEMPMPTGDFGGPPMGGMPMAEPINWQLSVILTQ